MDATRLDYLLNCYVDEGLLVEEQQELESQLLQSAEARQLFWSKILFHGLIRDCYEELSIQKDLDSAWNCSMADSDSLPIPEHTTSESLASATDPVLFSTEAAPPAFPLLGTLGNAWSGTVGFFSQEVPFSLLVATVLTALGLWGSSLIYVTQRQSIATTKRPPTSVPAPSNDRQEQTYVGQITGMANCKGQLQGAGTRGLEFDAPNDLKSHIALGDQFILSSGLMEITYDTGAKVILQGPVTYEVDSRDGGFLSVGKLTARLAKRGEGREESREKVASGQWLVASESDAKSRNPEISKSPASSSRPALTLTLSQRERGPDTNPQSLIPHPSSPAPRPQSLAPLFAVRTPTAVVTDLGTEFGVEVDPQGVTTSFVYRGSIQLQAIATDGQLEGEAKVLRQNEAARVNPAKSHRTIKIVPFENPRYFVRSIPSKATKTLDLVDILAGGNGSSQRRNRGINPTNGQPTDKPPPPDQFFLDGDKNYHRVAGIPFVDGVFVPADNAHPSQIDSAGHTFPDWFEPTCNRTYGYIWAGGKIPSSPGAHLRAVLDGIDYAEPIHSSIFLHANSGVTFDLSAIRKAHPGFHITKFVATTGNAESSSATLGDAGADVWVFIDGRVQFRRRQINYMNGAFAVNLPIAKTDRFLTLVSSDGNRSIGWDWIVFGDPRLELVEVEPTSNDTPTKSDNSKENPHKP